MFLITFELEPTLFWNII